MKKLVKVGGISLGDGKVYIQSMTNTQTSDVKATVEQILRLQQVGCQIVRVSVPDEKSAKALFYIKKEINIPLVADIHFDHKLAILAVQNGADKIRINPSNIVEENKIGEVAKVCNDFGVAIRVGINAGSLYKDIEKNGGNVGVSIQNIAKKSIQTLNNYNFDNIVLSAKTSNVLQTIQANRVLFDAFDYPIHLGLTEAGASDFAKTKSMVAIGSLLADGIGDTIRVSLCGEKEQEVFVAKQILRSVGKDKNFVEVICCPTCARTCINICEIAKKLEEKYKNVEKSFKIAVMGCVVNGIGEGKNADIGIAGGKEKSVIFAKGEQILTVDNQDAEKVFFEKIQEYIDEK